MATPLTASFSQPEAGPSSPKSTFDVIPPAPSEKEEGDDMFPMASFMPPVNAARGSLYDLTSPNVWRNHIIWRAGVSSVAISQARAISLHNHRV